MSGLEEIARKCLSSSADPLLSRHYHDLPAIFGYWSLWYETTPELILTAFGRIIAAFPSAHYYAKNCFSKQTLHFRNIHNADEPAIIEILVAMWRLLRHDATVFQSSLDSSIVWSLLQHASRPIRFLAISVLSYVLDMAEATLSKTLFQSLGDAPVIVVLQQGVEIDLRILAVEDALRVHNLLKLVNAENHVESIPTRTQLPPNVVEIAQVLLPSLGHGNKCLSAVVPTPTTERNLRKLASAVATSDAILVQGQAGSGKTFLIEDLAQSLARKTDLVRIHLGDQTDAKLLLGTYVTSDTPGKFTWQAGILANAVSQGKWLLVEDIDKAPNDVLSILMPLLEHKQLFVPSRDETILAGAGFKIFATKTTSTSSQWSCANLIGGRLWRAIEFELASNGELCDIISTRYPLLQNQTAMLMRVYESLTNLDITKLGKAFKRESMSRKPGTIDLFKLCRRIVALFKTNGLSQADSLISPALEDDIFSEAVDCFASSIATNEHKSAVIRIIGQDMHMPPERVQMYLDSYVPNFSDTQAAVKVGRVSLPKMGQVRKSQRPFAFTGHALRLVEQLMVAVQLREPVLLVGETGTGKTTVIQHLADITGHRLVAINMSQQTESGDLLGGFKPVDTKVLAIALLETFELLFAKTLSAHKNAKFLTEIRKSFNKAQWSKLSALLDEAIKIARRTLQKHQSTTIITSEETHKKKRKLNENLPQAWDAFSVDLENFQAQYKNSTFSFDFVEGTLISALRRGDWVLLDEINLAAADTLESISGLLQEDGSILLTEKGDTQAIVPHPNFRLFSCMNPATDVGKRDLPTGVRSRFTEVFVQPPDSNPQDLLAIIRQYISNLCYEDVHACEDVAQLYTITKEMARANRLVDGGNQRPHYSVRTLTRTLSYVKDICHVYGLRRSLFEGFCMSYLTLLNQESEALLKPIIEEWTILRSKNAKSFMAQMPKRPQTGDWVQFRHYWLPKGPGDVAEDARYIMTPFVEKNMLNLVRAASTKKFPILLQGPTSSGKTSMIEYLAKKTGHIFMRINNHEHTDLQEYLGSYMSDAKGNLVFQEGILVQALRLGHWLVLDELNLAPSDVLEALNRLLDDNRELLIPETQEIVKPHPSFILFATQNPAGLYGGRKHLSRAFRNRFLELHFEDIPEDELETILCQRCQIAPSYCKRIVDVYKQLSMRRQSSRIFEQKHSFATLRDLFRWASRPAVGYDELALNGYMLLAERVRREDEKQVVRAVIQKVMKVTLPTTKEYDVTDLHEFKTLNARGNDTGIVWTKAFRRLFMLLALAFRNNEPVLFIGETGCGKTAVCQLIAQALNRQLQILNAHQNTETADLIGAQRPVRSQSLSTLELIRDMQLFLQQVDSNSGQSDDLEVLRKQFELLSFDTFSEPDQSHMAKTYSALKDRVSTHSMALFEWADGPLVEAMKVGNIFLLDEISLAEDAVLERLNSVLETGRTLVMSEKGAQDAALVASPSYQFCATMNPGGDFGKKELSPALRNRFTEIWVPAMSDDEDILQILQASLVPELSAFGPIMLDFARFFCTTFTSALTSSTVSIRDLLSWAQFCNKGCLSQQESLVQGAALVYIDSLGVNKLSLGLQESDILQSQRDMCLLELSRLSGFECAPYYCIHYELLLTTSTLTIGPYTVPLGNAVVDNDLFEIEAPTTFKNATRVVRAMQLNKPILLEGSPGVGKTSLISAIARIARKSLVRINFSDQTDLMDLFGSDSPVEDSERVAFAWRDAPFLRAMQNGDWVLLDEMNLASQSILEGLNACLDHRGQAFIPELNRVFDRHPDFRVFAAQNPHSQGGGRKGLPKSFVNRFTVVYCDPLFSGDIHQICLKNFPEIGHETIAQVIKYIFEVQKAIHLNRGLGISGGPWEFNLRDVLRWLSILQGQNEQSFAPYYANCMVRQRLRTSADREFADRLALQVFGSEAISRPAFVTLTENKLSIGRTTVPRHESFMDAQLTYCPIRAAFQEAAETMLLCIAHAWPCIIAAPAGTGKTCLIETMAKLCGSRLRTIAMNSDMDASDLLGGFEQRDAARSIRKVLLKGRQLCQDIVRESFQPESLANLGHYIQCSHSQHYDEAFLADLQQLLENYLPRSEGLLEELKHVRAELVHPSMGHFQWADGSLVRAVLEGEWVILDNANLCDPSVLDRLNSLLEPGGKLIVNERIMADGHPMVIRPHKNFRIFMTVDPRNGELSRAMRNRGLEIFLEPSVDTLSFFQDSNSSVTTWHAITKAAESSESTSPFLAQALERQLHLSERIPQLCYITDAQKTVLQLMSQVSTSPGIRLISNSNSLGAPYKITQASALTSSTTLSISALEEYGKLELAFMIYEVHIGLDVLLQNLSQSLSKKDLKELSILSDVWPMLLQLGHDTLSDQILTKPADLMPLLKRISFVNHIGHGLGLDSVLFILHGVQLLSKSMQNQLSNQFMELLSRSKHFLPLTSGTSMQVIWSALRPSVPVSDTAMKHFDTVRQLLVRLDQSLRGSKYSGQLALELKKQYLQTLQWISASGSNKDGPKLDLEQTVEQSMEEKLRPIEKSRMTRLFAIIYSSIMLQQVAEFPSWRGDECPAFADLLLLNTLSDNESIELIDFMPCIDAATQTVSARFSALSRIAMRHIEITTVNSRIDCGDDFSCFINGWQSLITSSHELPLGRIEKSLSDLSELGYQVTRHGLAVLQPQHRTLSQHLVGRLASLVEILQDSDRGKFDMSKMTLALTSGNSPENKMKLELTLETLSAITLAINRTDMILESKNYLDKCVAQLRLFHDATAADRSGYLGMAWIYYARAMIVLYVPNVPRDPGQDLLQSGKLSEWTVARATSRAIAHKVVSQAFTGQQVNPVMDQLNQELAAVTEEYDSVPKISLYRPERSELYQLQAEFDFCLAMVRESGTLDRLLLAQSKDRVDTAAQASTWLSSLRELDNRLQSFRGYQDMTTPLLDATSALSAGVTLLYVCETPENSGAASLQSLPDPLALLNETQSSEQTNSSKKAILARLIELCFRISQFGQTPASLDTLFQITRELFKKWFVNRERDMALQAENSSLYKYSAPEEPTMDDYREIFPDYDDSQGLPVATTSTESLLDSRIFDLVASILRRGKDADASKKTTITQSINALLDLQVSSGTIRSQPENQGKQLAVMVYAASRNHSSLTAEVFHEREVTYDFYRGPNVLENKKIVPLLNQLQAKIDIIILAWPENSVLHDIRDGVNRLLELPMNVPVAQTLSMLEQTFASLAQWQEVASREFSLTDLFDDVRNRIIDWRRFELSCWPKLFTLEEQSAVLADSKIWYNLYEVIIFATSNLKDGFTHDFIISTVNSLLQYMRSASVGQFHARLHHLETFSLHVDYTFKSEQAISSFSQAIRHVFNYFSAYASSITDFLHQERKVLVKEVNQVIKLASWKDTNVFALRESSRRSHRTLYKIVHKFRRILLTPVGQVIARGLNKNAAISWQAETLVTKAHRFCAMLPSKQISEWPARYRDTARTARKIQSVTHQLLHQSSNRLASFVDEALETMHQLRAETPNVYDKTKLPLIKHLKNRKRKLLSDSFKTLKALGLKSTIPTDDLERQRVIEHLFLNVPHIAKGVISSDAIDNYFYRILDILPQIRAGYANHVEDVTSGEIKRGTGFFDSLFLNMLYERAVLASFVTNKSRYQEAMCSYRTVMASSMSTPTLLVGKSAAELMSKQSRCLTTATSWQQLLTLTQEYYAAHLSFSRSESLSLKEQDWWLDIVRSSEIMSQSLQSNPHAILPDSSASHNVDEMQRMFASFLTLIEKRQDIDPEKAYLFDALVQWLKVHAEFQPASPVKPGIDISLATLSDSLRNLSEAILLATQEVNEVLKQAAETTDESWYIYSTRNHRLQLERSRLPGITDMLQKLLMQLQLNSFTGSADDLLALSTHFGPILESYSDLCDHLLRRFEVFHHNTSRCTLLIGQTLNTLATNGFCSPQPADDAPGESKGTSEGTGLGDGEGVENITKDLEDDEDIGDLDGAEDSAAKNESDDKNDSKEVEDDMAGDLEDISEDGSEKDDDEVDETDSDEIDDELGEVNDSNETALDEKMWDSEKDDLRDKDTEKQENGDSKEDQNLDLVDKKGEEKHDEKDKQQEREDQPDHEAEEDSELDVNQNDDEVDEPEALPAQDEHENGAAPDEAENLELPDDLKMDDETQDLDQDSNADDLPDENEDRDSDMAEFEEEEIHEADPTTDQADATDVEPEEPTAEDNQGDELDPTHAEDEEVNEELVAKPDEDHEQAVDDDDSGDVNDGPEKGSGMSKSKDTASEQPKQEDPESEEIDIAPDNNEESSATNSKGPQDNREAGQQANSDERGTEELRSLGSALEQFRRLLNIDQASSVSNEALDNDNDKQELTAENDQFEHIAHDDEHDTQAMGPSNQDDTAGANYDPDTIMPDLEDNTKESDVPEAPLDSSDNTNEMTEEGAAESQARERVQNTLDALTESRKDMFAEDIEMSDDDSVTDAVKTAQPDKDTAILSMDIWRKHERDTRDLAHGLCEQLRLILEPTLATKMRGDFRTGKRLNMRRIIPYIASQFKKDKIWMRRSKPSKRQYQVMLAIDDSKSMAESSSIQLAFDTVALVATALSVLEVGQISVVKFGEEPEIVHAFRDQFSSDSGAKVFDSFTFDQTRTNIKALTSQSLDMFREARAQQHSSGAELWQLQFIISDGICEDHESIRRIMRQAREERIMVVFLVVDKKNSILEMSQVKYLPQANGTKKLHIQQYMAEFAFENFLIIQDVSELPGLLCSTLRQFFAASQ